MAEQKSALESWTEIVQAPDVRESVTGYLPLILSAAGALGVAPFAIMRWMNGDWIIAVIDTIIVTGFSSLGIYVYCTRKVRGASIAIALLAVGGTVVTFYLRGPQQIYWAFPALMTTFYLLKPREAVFLTLSMTAMLLPQLIKSVNPFEATTIAITIVVTVAFAYAFSVINNRQQQELINLATKDPLTGAGNRRAMETKLVEVTALFRRTQLPASLVLLDIDNFKRINDDHGHAAGDQILRRITQIINMRIRLTDTLYRIGGEEFVVIYDGADLESASRLAEQLRTLVEVNELAPGSSVTISLGVAELQDGESFDSWLQRADDALYQAKRAGRNTIRLAS